MLTFVAKCNPASRRTGPEFASKAVRTADTSWAYYVQLWVSIMFIKILNQSLLVKKQVCTGAPDIVQAEGVQEVQGRLLIWTAKVTHSYKLFCCKLQHQINKVTSRLAKSWPETHVLRQRIGWWHLSESLTFSRIVLRSPTPIGLMFSNWIVLIWRIWYTLLKFPLANFRNTSNGALKS